MSGQHMAQEMLEGLQTAIELANHMRNSPLPPSQLQPSHLGPVAAPERTFIATKFVKEAGSKGTPVMMEMGHNWFSFDPHTPAAQKKLKLDPQALPHPVQPALASVGDPLDLGDTSLELHSPPTLGISFSVPPFCPALNTVSLQLRSSFHRAAKGSLGE